VFVHLKLKKKAQFQKYKDISGTADLSAGSGASPCRAANLLPVIEKFPPAGKNGKNNFCI